MESNSALHSKVFVVLSRTQVKIWKGSFESGAIPVEFAEEFVSRDYKKVINQYFSGRNRSKLDPQFAERVSHELIGFDHLYLAGGGKGKASAVHNLATYLKTHHPNISKGVREIRDIDALRFLASQLING